MKEVITVRDFVRGTEKRSAMKNLLVSEVTPLTVVYTGTR